MLVEVPVYIALDTQGCPQFGKERPAGEVNFLIRFDTENDSQPIEYCKLYGKKRGGWFVDTGDVFATAFGSDEWRRLAGRIKEYPDTYAAQVSA